MFEVKTTETIKVAVPGGELRIVVRAVGATAAMRIQDTLLLALQRKGLSLEDVGGDKIKPGVLSAMAENQEEVSEMVLQYIEDVEGLLIDGKSWQDSQHQKKRQAMAKHADLLFTPVVEYITKQATDEDRE